MSGGPGVLSVIANAAFDPVDANIPMTPDQVLPGCTEKGNWKKWRPNDYENGH
jgi:hypothetical protein